MLVSVAFITAVFAVLPAFSAPTGLESRTTTCTNPTIRKSWTKLDAAQKQAYFDAELCLINAPAQTTNPGVVTRYDDLVAGHQLNSDVLGRKTDTWHVTGQFLAIHRYFLHIHETLLRNECGYTGPMVFWDQTVDAGAFAKSSVIADFGGPGNADGVVVDGPFGNIAWGIGPGVTNKPHVLRRVINETVSAGAAQSAVDELLANNKFADFHAKIAAFTTSIHSKGHLGVGGEMADIQSSPNDPLFFLHHSYLDAVWYRWQTADPSRATDFVSDGNETQAEPATGFVKTNAGTVLSFYDVLPNATVADVADTKGGLLCYEYEF